jgi:hypothetical protein
MAVLCVTETGVSLGSSLCVFINSGFLCLSLCLRIVEFLPVGEETRLSRGRVKILINGQILDVGVCVCVCLCVRVYVSVSECRISVSVAEDHCTSLVRISVQERELKYCQGEFVG